MLGAARATASRSRWPAPPRPRTRSGRAREVAERRGPAWDRASDCDTSQRGNGVIVRRRSTVPPSRRHTEHTSRRIMLSNLVQTVWVWRRSWSLSAGAQCLGVGDGLIEAARKQITLLCDVMQGRQARHPYLTSSNYRCGRPTGPPKTESSPPKPCHDSRSAGRRVSLPGCDDATAPHPPPPPHHHRRHQATPSPHLTRRSVHPHLSHSAPPSAIDRPRDPGAVSRGRVTTLVSILRRSVPR